LVAAAGVQAVAVADSLCAVLTNESIEPGGPENYTRNEWRKSIKTHSKRVKKINKNPLETSGEN
jgi:hypothetical protein